MQSVQLDDDDDIQVVVMTADCVWKINYVFWNTQNLIDFLISKLISKCKHMNNFFCLIYHLIDLKGKYLHIFIWSKW